MDALAGFGAGAVPDTVLEVYLETSSDHEER